MSKREVSYWKNEFGDSIYRVKAKTALPEKGAIGFVHGLGEHIGRYEHLFDFFLTNGFSVFGYDSYGHGKSEGKRGHLHSQAQWLNEIQMLVSWMSSQTNGPIILYGHSLGGLKSLLYLLKGTKLLDLAIVTSPFIEQGTPEPSVKIIVGKLLSYIQPKFALSNGLIVEGISRDAEVVRRYLSDSLNHDRISLKMGRIILNSAEELKEKRSLNIPLLLQHGTADLLTSYEATRKLSENWKGNITFLTWEQWYHELHNEPNKAIFLEKTLEWLNVNIAKIKLR